MEATVLPFRKRLAPAIPPEGYRRIGPLELFWDTDIAVLRINPNTHPEKMNRASMLFVEFYVYLIYKKIPASPIILQGDTALRFSIKDLQTLQ